MTGFVDTSVPVSRAPRGMPSRGSAEQVPLLATVGCVAAMVVWFEGASAPRAWAAAGAALLVAAMATRLSGRMARSIGWGLAVVVACAGSSRSHASLQVCRAVGAVTSALAASAALARVPPAGGMARSTRMSPVVGLVPIVAAWSAVLVVQLRPAGGWIPPVAHPGAWSLAAAVGTALVFLTQGQWLSLRRGLELGIRERVFAVRWSVATTFTLMVAVALLARWGVDLLAGLGCSGLSALVGRAALDRDAVRVAQVARRTAVLTVSGGCATFLGALVIASGATAGGAILSTAAAALAIGAAAPWLEGPLRPSRGARLDAFVRACAEAHRPEPEDAIRGALMALRAPTGLSSPSPQLWTVTPAQTTTVDPAGYLHDRDAAVPEALVSAAVLEPEQTLRADVLDALTVRRPELRPLAQWLSDQGALLATAIARDGEVEGLLVLPRVRRRDIPTLEELRGLRRTADALCAPCRARAAQSRLLLRAQAADLKTDAADEQVERVNHARALEAGRNILATTRLARPAAIGVYSVGARLALEALERRTSVGAPMAIVAPSGVDPVPYIARAHLSGARRQMPLVLVDSTSAREHDLERWSDPLASPLALADAGLLVLLDAAALPLYVQGLIARALAEKRAPWSRADPLDVELAVTAVDSPEALVREGRLDAMLAVRLGDARTNAVVLPHLYERIEDLRAIITDRFAQEGMRVIGRPVGIEHAAYARLIEHPFPGEDAELAVIAQRLVARCTDDIVRVRDVDALRLSAPPPNGGRSGSVRPRKGPISA